MRETGYAQTWHYGPSLWSISLYLYHSVWFAQRGKLSHKPIMFYICKDFNEHICFYLAKCTAHFSYSLRESLFKYCRIYPIPFVSVRSLSYLVTFKRTKDVNEAWWLSLILAVQGDNAMLWHINDYLEVTKCQPCLKCFRLRQIITNIELSWLFYCNKDIMLILWTHAANKVSLMDMSNIRHWWIYDTIFSNRGSMVFPDSVCTSVSQHYRWSIYRLLHRELFFSNAPVICGEYDHLWHNVSDDK